MIEINNCSLTLSDLKHKGLDLSLLNYINNNSKYRGNCPLYLREEGQFSLIKDCVINENSLTLLKPSFPNWLYRGGGVVNLTTKLGLVVRFDDRHNWWKPSTAGIADVRDGSTPEQVLINSALRELSEEITIIADQKINLLDQPKKIKFAVNEPDKAIEAVININLSSYNIINIIAREDDDIIPTIGVLNQKRIVGIYNQTQGYIDLQMVNVHPSVL